MGRQRNNVQLKGKEESPERVLSEIEASQQSGIEFKTMVIKNSNELSANYQKPQGTYKELTANCISIKNDIETINKGQEDMQNIISELKNIVEGIKSMLT